ncbi:MULTISPECIES: DUF6167 family protein [Streptomyces]|uniref:DUF6167 family protein n=1 Tax=Streptomyces silvisoli TaxID=3034235 RepID=A0ABT5ZGD6_9ACTN|nr:MULTISPECIES: DUF6167 family protein [Streptomyces]MDF3288885.1 DUF6167 family protein [Streptomyces silvisoli]
MFRRLFWFVTGITAGVWATNKVHRAARRLTPEGLAATAADRAIELGGRARRFAKDVRAGMSERESQLNNLLGLDAPHAELPGQRPEIAYQADARTPQTRPLYEQKEGH